MFNTNNDDLLRTSLIQKLNSDETLKAELNLEELFKTQEKQVVISYKYVFINKLKTVTLDKFCFKNNDFANIDYKIYFEKLYFLTNLTFTQIYEKNDLIDLKSYEGKTNPPFFNILRKHFKLDNEQQPLFGHFKLYNSPYDIKDNKLDFTNIKAPRIYFIFYTGIIYPIYFDMYHQINAKKNKSRK